ncbi:MAG: hypothetical protein RLZZ511_3506 [Cyanobacteriota bacterium]|jgi:hypothetical protein
MTIQRTSLTVALLTTASVALAPAAQAANWVELGKATTGEMVQLNLASIGVQRGFENFEFVYQIGMDKVAASVNCPTRKVYPEGYTAYVPNVGSTTDRMVDRVCAIGRRITTSQKKPPVLPLQVGTYYGGGSKYIQIAKQGDRFCYQGSSSRGMTIANLIPSRNGTYAINTWKDSFVKQQDADRLLFGSAENMLAYPMDQETSGELSQPMQDCLNSTEPFFQQYDGMRNPVRVK